MISLYFKYIPNFYLTAQFLWINQKNYMIYHLLQVWTTLSTDNLWKGILLYKSLKHHNDFLALDFLTRCELVTTCFKILTGFLHKEKTELHCLSNEGRMQTLRECICKVWTHLLLNISKLNYDAYLHRNM